MKIAILGLGKMGSLINSVANSRGHRTITIDPNNPEAQFKDISSSDIAECDCCIEFSHPSVVLDNIDKVISTSTPLVVGTTGWYDHIPEIKKRIESTESAFLYASNFSIGVHIFSAIVQRAAELINAFEEYDVAGFESHHNQKADSPSGTARTLADIVMRNIDRKESIVFGAPDRKLDESELQFSSLRCGSIPGTHEIVFDSQADSIELCHRARNRKGFALGAVQAAEWLQGKKGFFSIDDLIEDALKGK